jgi:hypothetical protein
VSSQTRPDSARGRRVGSFERERFAELGFLDGDWRGTTPDGKPFFERYRVTSDSTIQMYGFPDSAMTVATDSALIFWRGSRIYSESGNRRSVVTRMDSSGIHFRGERSGNRFTWKPEGDGWVASLRPPGATDDSRNVVYVMRPHSRE